MPNVASEDFATGQVTGSAQHPESTAGTAGGTSAQTVIGPRPRVYQTTPDIHGSPCRLGTEIAKFAAATTELRRAQAAHPSGLAQLTALTFVLLPSVTTRSGDEGQALYLTTPRRKPEQTLDSAP
jgi:hypothetical protein